MAHQEVNTLEDVEQNVAQDFLMNGPRLWQVVLLKIMQQISLRV